MGFDSTLPPYDIILIPFSISKRPMSCFINIKARYLGISLDFGERERNRFADPWEGGFNDNMESFDSRESLR
jgi:hypothetical protein